jgi:hypothetical protein
MRRRPGGANSDDCGEKAWHSVYSVVSMEDGRVGPYGCIRSGLNVYLGPLGKQQVDQPSSED